MKNISVFGIFTNKLEAENAVDRFKAEGFRNSDISLLMSDSTSTREFAHQKNTKAPEGATAGASTGLILGGALGWLVGAGMLAIPVVGPLVAAGPLLGLLAGAGVGGAVGGLTGALIGLGIPEYEAKRFEGYVKDGGILISIHSDDNTWAAKGKKLLQELGAKDISSAGEASADLRAKAS
jgi:hypothetical protein